MSSRPASQKRKRLREDDDHTRKGWTSSFHHEENQVAPPQKDSALCDRCCKIDIDELHPKGAEQRTPSRIMLGRPTDWSPECHLCQIFISLTGIRAIAAEATGQGFYNSLYYLVPFYTSAVFGKHGFDRPRPPDIDVCTSFAVIRNETLRDSADEFFAHVSSFGWMTPLSPRKSTATFNARNLQSEIDFGIIRGWLDFCSAHHQSTCDRDVCRPTAPIQVVDCRTQRVIPLDDEAPYLALSYVWGDQSRNETQKHSEQLPRYLPKLIEDAMTATMRLGFQYLWIDRYCIDQEDEPQRMTQILQMDLIYAKATATIIAAAGKNPSDGLPGVSKGSRSPRSCTVGNQIYSAIPCAAATEIEGSVWNSRGWTYQEATLSRRRIFFLHDQVYFECHGMHCCESIDVPLKDLHVSSLKHFSQWNRGGVFEAKHPKTPSNDLLLDHAFDHIARYSIRNMTYPRDILNGFLGIIQMLKDTYQVFNHICGLPIVPDTTLKRSTKQSRSGCLQETTATEQFATALCWRARSARPRRAGFPSWSWIGWHGAAPIPEIFKSDLSTLRHISNTFNISIRVEGEEDDAHLDWRTEPLNRQPSLIINYLLVDAPVLSFSIPNLVDDRDETDLSTPHRSLSITIGKGSVEARFSLTRMVAPDDDLYRRLCTDHWTAIPLGERVQELKHPQSGKQMECGRVLVLLVIDESLLPASERIGLLEIRRADNRADYSAWLEATLEERRTIRLG